jgi:hypothetical protein
MRQLMTASQQPAQLAACKKIQGPSQVAKDYLPRICNPSELQPVSALCWARQENQENPGGPGGQFMKLYEHR